MRAELYPDRSGAWRWRIRSRNGRIVAASGEAFSSKRAALRAIVSLRRAMFREALKDNDRGLPILEVAA